VKVGDAKFSLSQRNKAGVLYLGKAGVVDLQTIELVCGEQEEGCSTWYWQCSSDNNRTCKVLTGFFGDWGIIL